MVNPIYSQPPAQPIPEFTEPHVTIRFGAQELQIQELSVAQVIALSAHTEAIAALDFSDVPKLFARHHQQMIELLSIALAVPQERILDAKASQLTEALAAVIALNKAFFLQAVQAVVQGAILKATVQSQIQAANQALQAKMQAQQKPQPMQPPSQQPSGPMASQPSSPSATASEMSSPIPGAAISPTAPPLIATAAPEPESSS